MVTDFCKLGSAQFLVDGFRAAVDEKHRFQGPNSQRAADLASTCSRLRGIARGRHSSVVAARVARLAVDQLLCSLPGLTHSGAGDEHPIP